MKKWLKRIGLTIVILAVLLVGVGWAISYFYKDEVIDAVVEQSNKHITGRLDVTDASISLFKSFPSIQVRLDDVVVEGPDFEGRRDSLAFVKYLYLKAPLNNLWVKDGQYTVEEVIVSEPTIRAITYDKSYQNWSITKPSDANDNAPSSLTVNLEKIKIEQGNVLYLDAISGTAFQVTGMDHESQGAFGNENFKLISTTTAESVSMKSGNKTYLDQLPVDAKLDLGIDQKQGMYQVEKGELILGKYPVDISGNVQQESDAYAMDLELSSMSSSLLNLMAISPYLKQSIAEQIDANGDLSLSGTVKGKLDIPHNNYPALDLAVKMNNGSFKVDEFPERIEKLFADLRIKKAQGDLDKLNIEARQLNFELDDNPFTTSFIADHLLSDIHAEGEAKGKLDFEKLNHIFSFEEMGVRAGELDLDLAFNIKKSYIDNNDFDKVDAAGFVKGKNIKYVYNDQNIYVNDLDLDVNKKLIDIKKFEGNLDDSPFKLVGKVTDPLHMLSDRKKWKADVDIEFDKININTFIANDDTNAPDIQKEIPKYLKNGEIAFNARGKELKYQAYDFKNVKTEAIYTFDKLSLKNTKAQLFEDAYKTEGRIENIAAYLYENGSIEGSLKADANSIHVDNFLSKESTNEGASPKEAQPFQPPQRINLTVNTNSPTVYYDNMKMNNLRGKVILDDGRVRFQDIVTEMLDGTIHASGAYQIQSTGEPKLDLNTKIKSMSFSQAFKTFNSWEALMPIGKYIEGRFNTEFDMASVLDNSYFPKIETISLDGVMQTLDGVIKEWTPLKKLNEKLNLDIFSNLSIDNTWNKIHINDGNVTVDPFEKTVKGVDLTIQGSHGLDRQMDYQIRAVIPKKILDQAGWTKASNAALSDINKQFSNLGVDELKVDKIPINIKMTGTMKNPNISFSVEKPNAKDLVTNIKDAAKKEINSKVDSVKTEVKKTTTAIKDTVKNTVKKEVKKEIGKILTGEQSDTTKNDPKKNVEDAAKKEIDKVKDKIGKWNPFKKGN